MRNKVTGEFELVVGDKQLLSGFFIGVLLLAVVFALGYVLGQNSPKSAKLPADASAPVQQTASQDSRPQPASAAPASNPEAAASSPSTTPAQTAEAGANPPAEPPPQPTTQPVRETAAPANPQPPAAKPAVPPPVAPSAEDAANASYWQVQALASRTSAVNVMQTLKESGFPASLRPGPNNLTLVWVGPYMDRASLAEAKDKLEKAGFSRLTRKP